MMGVTAIVIIGIIFMAIAFWFGLNKFYRFRDTCPKCRRKMIRPKAQPKGKYYCICGWYEKK